MKAQEMVDRLQALIEVDADLEVYRTDYEFFKVYDVRIWKLECSCIPEERGKVVILIS